MAVLHKKEEKIQAVLGRLPKKYTDEQFVEMFIRLYSKDWGKIKSAYIKQSQDKEPGTIINMPKPEVYLRQVLANYLQQDHVTEAAAPKEEPVAETPATGVKKTKAPAKKEVAVEEAPAGEQKKKVSVKKKAEATETPSLEVKKAKAPAKKKAEATEEAPVAEKKTKAAAKKPATKK